MKLYGTVQGMTVTVRNRITNPEQPQAKTICAGNIKITVME